MGAILTKTSYPQRTSPVTRGQVQAHQAPVGGLVERIATQQAPGVADGGLTDRVSYFAFDGDTHAISYGPFGTGSGEFNTTQNFQTVGSCGGSWTSGKIRKTLVLSPTRHRHRIEFPVRTCLPRCNQKQRHRD